MAKTLQESQLVVRPAVIADIPGIQALMSRSYQNMPTYTASMLRGQLTAFPEGQFVALHEDSIIAYSASFRIVEGIALADHTWREITGNGFASRHDPNGDVLYGMEVAVDPTHRSMRIGRRLYNERKRLCERLGLKGIIFVGRLPGFQRHSKRVASVNSYVDQVRSGALKDPVLSFQLRNGFEFIRVVRNYLQSDQRSLGFGALLYWRNPRLSVEAPQSPAAKSKNRVRVAAVQYKQRKLASFGEFKQNVEYFVDAVAEYGADFVLFPEFFTLQLLSTLDAKLPPDQALDAMMRFSAPFSEMMSGLAVRYNINIIGGSHLLRRPNGKVRNVCHVFLRDGAIHEQEKIHPTPSETKWWNVTGGSHVSMIETDCGPIGVLICYDCEFPELPRHLVDQGAKILFVPVCTDTREAYNRVRYCAQARAVENQVYVVLAGNVGNLPAVENMDIQYAQSCVLEPCDFGFARDGIAADTTANTEMVAIADLRLEDLQIARNAGTVRPLKDRRHDLYSIVWHDVAEP